jgi:hypothetical protein
LKIVHISQTSPTIKKTWTDYPGERTVDAIQSALYRYCPSSFILSLPNAEAPAVLTNGSYLKAFVFPSSEEDLAPLKFLAWHMRNIITVYNGLEARQAIRSHFHMTKLPFLLVQTSSLTDASNTFSFSNDKRLSLSQKYSELNSFVGRFAIALPELNTGDDFTKYCLHATAPICLIALIHDPYSDPSLQRIRILEDISKTSGSPFVFMWINRDVHDDVMINYDPETLQEKTDPDVLIFNSRREKFGAWFGSCSWDKQTIMTMLDEIKVGNTKLVGDPPQFHPFYEWISAEKGNLDEKQEL